MIWNAVVPGVALLGFVIFVHELGHFLMAKWRGVRVLRFSLGFGPRMLGFTRGETEYRLAWIPFGGYVQMAGDSPDPNEAMPSGTDEFLSHPWYGRLMIAAAGPAANLITAFLVMCAIGLVGVSYPDFPNVVGATPDTSIAAQHGVRAGDRIVSVAGRRVESWVPIFVANSETPNSEGVEIRIERGGVEQAIPLTAEQREPFFSSLQRPEVPAVVGAVVTGMPAYKAGVREGDRIVSVNGQAIHSWGELPGSLKGTVDQKVRLELERDGRRLEVEVVPMDPEGRGLENARIGIEAPRQGSFVQRYNPLESLELGARGTVALVGSVYGGMWLTLSRPLYYREYVGGPLFIAQAASENARRGLDSYLQFLAMINVAIMAFNLLPLPILDGGHILLALIEAVRRQTISARTYLRFQQAGLVIMGALLVLILTNDPLRVIKRQRALGKTQSTTTASPEASAPEEKPVVPTPP